MGGLRHRETSERRAFCVQVECRDAGTLELAIRENIEEESIVFTDGWKSYSRIAENCNVVHRTVNHSRFFKDPETGVCTNTVEGLNTALKSAVPVQHRTERNASLSLVVFIWLRMNKK